MKSFVNKIFSFFITDSIEIVHRAQAKMLCVAAPLIGSLSVLIFLFPPEPDEILQGFGLFAAGLLLAIPFVLKVSQNYKLASAVFTSVSLAIFPLCLFEYGGLLSPVLLWLPLMPILLGYLLGWKEGMNISFLFAFELVVLGFVNRSNSNISPEQLELITTHTISALMAICAGIILSYRLESKKRNKETELSASQNNLEEALRAKELFWNNISHEIRTPLNGILGMTQVLLEADSTAEQKQLLKIIKESGNHLKAVLNDVVDYSRLELGDLKIKKEPFEVEPALKKITLMFSDYLAEKDVQISYEIHKHFPQAILTDSYRIRQVLIHLISNSVKFTNAGYIKIRAELTEVENVFTFSVTDSGKGIKKKDHSKIFSTFYQGDISATREHGGTGLGLALCKRLMDTLDGSIDFESEEGRGSHFFFSLTAMPLDLNHELNIVQRNVLTSTLTNYNLKNSTLTNQETKEEVNEELVVEVLIVEDNPVNLTLMETLVKQLGHNVRLAVNGKEALEIMETQSFDIVFMDIQMPIMDGIECTKNILKIYGEQRPAIVAVTANVHQREECIELGMDDFIGKPINVSKIKRSLRRLISPAINTAELGNSKIDIDEGPMVFEPNLFVENFGNDQEIIFFLIDQFRENSPKLIEDIENAIQTKNYKKLESSAHSIKGALSNFFTHNLREQAVQLEKCAAKKDLKKAAEIFLDLKIQVDILQIELDDCFKNKKAAS
ncbi:MAG: signal transduction histidine kinase/CheY-like chemotaxis protein [Bacteriovoracaceae bacterium]|jgi:signal transduction histidine kinase/CheY-like chemotaxis protein/HPt (histidine-containing phosphotransfer) domain-containing protein